MIRWLGWSVVPIEEMPDAACVVASQRVVLVRIGATKADPTLPGWVLSRVLSYEFETAQEPPARPMSA